MGNNDFCIYWISRFLGDLWKVFTADDQKVIYGEDEFDQFLIDTGLAK